MPNLIRNKAASPWTGRLCLWLRQVGVDVESESGDITLRATGSQTVFPGFMAVWGGNAIGDVRDAGAAAAEGDGGADAADGGSGAGGGSTAAAAAVIGSLQARAISSRLSIWPAAPRRPSRVTHHLCRHLVMLLVRRVRGLID